MPSRRSRSLFCIAAFVAAAGAGAAAVDAATPAAADPTDPPAPPDPTTVAPDDAGPGGPPDDSPGTDFLRAEAEDEFTVEHPGATEVACVEPSADAPGVRFTCYGTMPDGEIVAAEAVMNDLGGIEFGEPGGGPPATAAPPPAATEYSGEGNQLVEVPRITLLTIVEATHEGDGEFRIQPQDAGAPVGGPIVDTDGASAGRYLVGADGAVSALAVVASGSWSIRVAPITEALPVAPSTALTGDAPDVASFTEADGLTIDHSGDGPVVVTAYTAAGRATLLDDVGPLTEDVTLPTGPGYVTVDAAGPWTLGPTGVVPEATGG